MMPSLVKLTERIKGAIRSMPGEKQSQLGRTTIHATGLAMAVPGLAQAIASNLGYPLKPFSSPVHPSIEGVKIVLKELGVLKRIMTPR